MTAKLLELLESNIKKSLIDTKSNNKISTVINLQLTDASFNTHGNMPSHKSMILFA